VVLVSGSGFPEPVYNRWSPVRTLPPPSLLQARHMSAQDYYRGDYASRPLSPPMNAVHDASGNLDRHNATDVDERTGGIPERITTPNLDNDNSIPLHLPPTNGTLRRSLIHPGTEGRTTRKGIIRTERTTTWRIRTRRRPLCLGFVSGGRVVTRTLVCVPPFSLRSFISTAPRANSWVICRVRGGESNRSGDGTSDGAR
jgi:hypothetical protein